MLAATGGIKGPCEVERIDKSGAVSTFAKLPDAGATECRDLEFGAAGSPFAGKLYAVTSGNASIYAIDSSGKASAFGTYNKPVPFELTTITFPPSSDSKAAGMMLIGMRAKGGFAAKVGRIGMVGADGKLKDDVYLVGFIRPSGFAWSPSTFGSYSDELMIADTGKFASENDNERDGVGLPSGKRHRARIRLGPDGSDRHEVHRQQGGDLRSCREGEGAGRDRDYFVDAVSAKLSARVRGRLGCRRSRDRPAASRPGCTVPWERRRSRSR